MEALTRFAPNVSVNKVPAGASNATVRIRGIANPEVIITTDPKVTLYLDDVLIGKAAGSMLDLIDLQRIEVEAKQKVASAKAEADALALQRQQITPDLLALRKGSAIGLIVYSGSAHLVMPLTRDERIVSAMIEETAKLHPRKKPIYFHGAVPRSKR